MSDKYSIHVYRDHEDGGYIAVALEFRHVSAFGNTREEALREAMVALKAAIETYREEGWVLPGAMRPPVGSKP